MNYLNIETKIELSEILFQSIIVRNFIYSNRKHKSIEAIGNNNIKRCYNINSQQFAIQRI